MKRIKENLNAGHFITIAIFAICTIGSVVANYYAIKYTGNSNTNQIQAVKKNLEAEVNELNARMHNLNERVQDQNNNWANLIERLDDRYVNEQQFEDFRANNEKQLKEINKNINYLIKLQIEGR